MKRLDQHFAAQPVQAFGMSHGPSNDLPLANRPGFRRLFITLRPVHVTDLPAAGGHAKRQVGVLRQRVRVPSADRVERGSADSADGPAELRSQPQIEARLLADLVAGGPFQSQQGRKQAAPGIVRNHTAHHRADFRIAKRRHQHLEHGAAGEIVRVEQQQDLAGGLPSGVYESRAFSARSRGPVNRA